MKSLVLVPDDAGIELALQCENLKQEEHDSFLNLRISLTLGQIARSITKTHVPPMLDCTPYQILQCNEWNAVRTRHNTHHAIAALLNTHHKLPNIPKLARFTTGKVIWNIAPGRPASIINGTITP